MEFLVSDADCFIKKHGTPCHIKAIGVLHFDVYSVQVLVPSEGGRDANWLAFLVFNLSKHCLVVTLHIR